MAKKKSFWEKYGYTAGWISLIFVALLGIPTLYYIRFLWTGTPNVVITNEGCLNITDGFKTFLNFKCNEMDVQQSLSLTESDFSNVLNLPSGASLNVKMNKGDVYTCTAFVRCSYTMIVSDTLTIHDCLSYCITRLNGTNECHSNC